MGDIYGLEFQRSEGLALAPDLFNSLWPLFCPQVCHVVCTNNRVRRVGYVPIHNCYKVGQGANNGTDPPEVVIKGHVGVQSLMIPHWPRAQCAALRCTLSRSSISRLRYDPKCWSRNQNGTGPSWCMWFHDSKRANAFDHNRWYIWYGGTVRNHSFI